MKEAEYRSPIIAALARTVEDNPDFKEGMRQAFNEALQDLNRAYDDLIIEMAKGS